MRQKTLTFLGGDVSLSSLTVTADDIVKGSITSTFQLFSALKSSSRQYKLTLKRKSKAVESIIRTEGDVKAVLMDDGNTLFSGYLSTNYSWTLSDSGEQDLSITIEDNGSKLLGKPFVRSGKHLFKCTLYNALKAICDKCGLEISPSIPVVTTEIVKVVSEGDTCKDILSTLLYEAGYVYYFENDGRLNLFSFLTLPQTESVSLDGTSLIVNGTKAITLSKKVRQYKSAKVKYTELGRAENYLVYRNTTGQDASHKYCNLSLKPNEAFDGAEVYTIDPTVTRTATLIEAVNAESESETVGSRDIIAIENLSSQIEKSDNITASITATGGPYLQIAAENKSSNTYSITRLDAYADVIYEKAQGVVISGEDTDSSDNTLEEEMEYIHDKESVEKHANLLTSYYKYSGATYTFYSRENISCGSVVKINDDVFTGLSVLVLVYAKTEMDSTNMVEYKAVGYSEFDFDKTTIVQRQLFSPIKGQGQKGEKGDKGDTGEKGEKGDSAEPVYYRTEYLLDRSPTLSEDEQKARSDWKEESYLSWSWGYYIYKRITKTDTTTTSTYLGRDTSLESSYSKRLHFSLSSDRSTYSVNKRSSESETITLMLDERYYSPDLLIWRKNGEIFTPTMAEDNPSLYTFTLPRSIDPITLKITVVPSINDMVLTGVMAEVIITPLDETEYFLFSGAVDELPGVSREYLSGDSCYYRKENVIYVYNGTEWERLGSSALSDTDKMTVLTKAEKVAFEEAVERGLCSDYAYFDTIFSKYVKARIIGAETIELTGDEGRLVGGDWETEDSAGYLVNQGVYIDSTGVAKFTRAFLNNSFIKGGTIEALSISGEIVNDVLSTRQTATAGTPIVVGAVDTSNPYYKGVQAKTELASKLEAYNTVYPYSGVYAGKSYSKVLKVSGESEVSVKIEYTQISPVNSSTYSQAPTVIVGSSSVIRANNSRVDYAVGTSSWSSATLPELWGTGKKVYGSSESRFWCYDVTTGYMFYSTDGKTWYKSSLGNDLFYKGENNPVSFGVAGSIIFISGYTGYNGTNFTGYTVYYYASNGWVCPSYWQNWSDYRPLTYFSENAIYGFISWDYILGEPYYIYTQNTSKEELGLPEEGVVTSLSYIPGGYLIARNSSGVYYAKWTPGQSGRITSSSYTLLRSGSYTCYFSSGKIWALKSGSTIYVYYGLVLKTTLSDTSTLSKADAPAGRLSLTNANKNITYELKATSYGYQSGLNFLSSSGEVVAYESEMSDYMQNQECTMYNGSTTLLSLPSSIPDSMDIYRRIPELFEETNLFTSISSINIEEYVRFDTSVNADVRMAALTSVPTQVSISPASLSVDGTERLNAAWFIKNKTTLTATIVPNSRSAGVETGNLEPKTTGNSIGGITPYSVIKGTTISATNLNAESLSSFKIGGKTLLDIFYPVGSIYLSISATSPASWLGGSWTKVSSGYALWTASSGAGNTISAGLPNIKGYAYSGDWLLNFNMLDGYNSSALKVYKSSITSAPSRVDASWSYDSTGFQFDASSYNSIYGNSSSVQPPAYKVYAWRRTS